MLLRKKIPLLPRNWVTSYTALSSGSPKQKPPSDLLLQLIQLISNSMLYYDVKHYTMNDKFPGEHYYLLRILSKELKRKFWLEIGTYNGESAYHILHNNDDVKLVSFDILPIQDFSNRHFFNNNNFTQIISDLSQNDNFLKYESVIKNSDVIFLDGPKNVKFEKNFLKLLSKIEFRPGTILIMDDIKTRNLIGLYSRIISPKIDVSTFGHFSGTAIIDLSNKLEFDFS